MTTNQDDIRKVDCIMAYQRQDEKERRISISNIIMVYSSLGATKDTYHNHAFSSKFDAFNTHRNPLH